MNCPDESVLLAYISGTHNPVIENHLVFCSACREIVDEMSGDPVREDGSFPFPDDEIPTPARLQELLGAFADVMRGAKIGRYVVVEFLAQGGMSEVFVGYDPELDRKVAIKLMHADGTHNQRKATQARLLREAQAMARLSHPNVINVFGVERFEGQTAIVMEFGGGGTLRKWLKEKERPWREILEAFIQAARGLAAAHEAGLVHRDFKPDNVLLTQGRRVCVTDFGLVRSVRESPKIAIEENAKQVTPRSSAFEKHITREGTLVGTPAYMAPEQFNGGEVDARTDQYSFFVALWEALFGEKPWEASNYHTMRQKVLSGDKPTAPANTSVPAWLIAVITKGMARNPDARFASMLECISALDPHVRERKTRSGAIIGISLFVFAACIFAFVLSPSSPQSSCSTVGTGFAGVWDAHVNKDIRSKFLATNAPFALEVFQRVSRQIDQYVLDWKSTWHRVCSSTGSETETPEQLRGRRVLCLAKRRDALGDLTAGLSVAVTRKTILKAPQAVNALPEAEHCLNTAALLSQPSPPANSDLRAEVQAIERTLQHALTLSELGKKEESSNMATRAVEEARSTMYSPILGRALLVHGRLLERRGEYKLAERALRDAILVASFSGDQDTHAHAFSKLVWVVGYKQERFLEANAMTSVVGDRLLRSANASEYLVAKYHNIQGSVFQRQGNFTKADDHFRTAIEIATKHAKPESLMLADAEHNLGNLLKEQGRYVEALALHKNAMAAYQKQLGPTNTVIPVMLGNIAVDFAGMGRYEDARKTLDESIAALRTLMGPEHPLIGSYLSQVGRIELKRQRHAEAIRVLRTALQAINRAWGTDHSEAGKTQLGLGEALLANQTPHLALPHLTRAVEILKKKPGDSLLLADARFALAQALAALRESPKDASTLAEQALNCFTKSKHPNAKNRRRAIKAWLAKWDRKPRK